MRTLSIGERFKDARIVHNQHGKQTMSEVEAATGVRKSMISGLENDSGRDIGYTNIILLAKHYGVSTDYLLGISDTRSIDTEVKAVTQYTGLSEDNVNYLHNKVTEKVENPASQWGPTLFVLINTMVDLSKFSGINEPFFKLREIHKAFQRNIARNSGTDQEVANWIVHKRGYTAVSPNDAISFYAHQISQTIERSIIERYAVQETSELYGEKRTVIINGKEYTLTGE